MIRIKVKYSWYQSQRFVLMDAIVDTGAALSTAVPSLVQRLGAPVVGEGKMTLADGRKIKGKIHVVHAEFPDIHASGFTLLFVHPSVDTLLGFRTLREIGLQVDPINSVLLKSKPDHDLYAETLLLLSGALINEDKYDEAIKYAKEAKKISRKHAGKALDRIRVAYLNKAITLYSKKDYENAVKTIGEMPLPLDEKMLATVAQILAGAASEGDTRKRLNLLLEILKNCLEK